MITHFSERKMYCPRKDYSFLNDIPRYSGWSLKQVIHPHLRLHDATVSILPNSVGGNHDPNSGAETRFYSNFSHLSFAI